MFSPISQNNAVKMVLAVGDENSGNPAAKGKGESKIGVVGPKRSNFDDEGLHQAMDEVQLGEVRKSEVTDGELKTKVYDSNGKLLRVIPPGYLPAGEQKFDVII